MQYDGKGKLAEAIAELCGVSVKSQARIAALIKQAKTELGITSKAKQMPDDMKLAIYRWHYERLSPVQNVKQDEGIQVDDEKPVLSPDSLVYDVKQTDDVQDNPVQSLHDTAVQYVKQTECDKLEVLPDSTVQNVKQDNPILDDDVIDDPVYDFKQIHFALTIPHNGKPKRTTVMLEGYLVKALQRKHGLTDNPAVRAWIEQAIKDDGDRFDGSAPLTRQLKRVIIESFV
ncbi:MAG: hypothetical protein PSU93_01740 [Methylobacter sp.]|uniref:Uncharacterized protein n=1 Tax=Candidatus Methylobacter titanis TaxID=3053457 RepID=A0AA43TKA6_9GAMM|nr:hypothetical protein [Candidatus Methylobacter titanis]